MQGLKNQRGASIIATTLFIVMLLGDVFLAMKVGPAYFTDQKVRRAMTTLPERMKTTSSTSGGMKLSFKEEVKRLMYSYLQANGERDIPVEKMVFKKSTGGNINISLDYEVKTHLLYNIDAIMTFSNTVEVPYVEPNG